MWEKWLKNVEARLEVTYPVQRPKEKGKWQARMRPCLNGEFQLCVIMAYICATQTGLASSVAAISLGRQHLVITA